MLLCMLLQSLFRGNVGRLLVEMKVDELMDAEMAAAAVRIQSIARGAKVNRLTWHRVTVSYMF